jgi:Ca-activated chloride channel family protein
VALFGSLLKNSAFTGKTSWDDLIKMATACYDPNDVSQKEYLQMIGQAKKIYHKVKRRKPIF